LSETRAGPKASRTFDRRPDEPSRGLKKVSQTFKTKDQRCDCCLRAATKRKAARSLGISRSYLNKKQAAIEKA